MTTNMECLKEVVDIQKTRAFLGRWRMNLFTYNYCFLLWLKLTCKHVREFLRPEETARSGLRFDNQVMSQSQKRHV